MGFEPDDEKPCVDRCGTGTSLARFADLFRKQRIVPGPEPAVGAAPAGSSVIPAEAGTQDLDSRGRGNDGVVAL